MSRPAPRPSARAGALAVAALLAGCAASPPAPRDTGDPTVLLATGAGGELGVSTPYGVVFLGLGARSGEVEFEVHFADGPSYERGIVEPLGEGLYVTHAEIDLPTVPLSYGLPATGEVVRVRGRWPDGFHPEPMYELRLVAAADERVEGLLLATSDELAAFGHTPVGAGVYVDEAGETRLAGLVTGRLWLDASGASPAGEYLTVAGPDRLWRLVTHGRDAHRPERKVYRRDVLP